MLVWLPETTAIAESKAPPTLARRGQPAASFLHDNLRAINDGLAPLSSDDLSVPRFSWWDHKGTREWASLTFKTPQRISRAEVYWFDDTGHGGCRVPKSWEMQWLDGETWRPVTDASPYATAKHTFNRVTFDTVKTKSVRILVQLHEGMSGGILEWRLPK